jgi:hypothetical protein
MNKKILIILVGLLFVGLVFTAIPAYAQDQDVVSIGEVSDPGILPDSPFYFLKGWGRSIRSLFTFDALKKAELELKFANEDALAIEKLCDKGECELAEKFCEKFQEQFQRTIQRMEKAKQKGKDVEALTERLKENHLRQQRILAEVLERAPEQAKEGILKAIENSTFGLENAIENVQGKHKMEQFREELNLQIRNMGEETQLRIQERLERKRQKPEEIPVGESQKQEPAQREPNQREPGQREPAQREPAQEELDQQEPQQQEPSQKQPQQQEPTQKGPSR